MSAERYKRTLDNLTAALSNLQGIGRPTHVEWKEPEHLARLADVVASHLAQAIEAAHELAGESALQADRMSHNARRAEEHRRLDDVAERDKEAARLAVINDTIARAERTR